MPFGLERGLKLLLGLELVFLLDVVDDALELLVAHLVAELLAALHDEHLVHGLDHDLRRHLVERLLQLLVAGVGLEVHLLALLPQRAPPAAFRDRSW